MPSGAVFAALGRGWACPGCGHAGYAELEGRAVCQCNRCKRQVGLTAGTVFHWTRLPLTVWFLAIYRLTQSKRGMSSGELTRRLGTRQPTAWLIKHKLMAAMAAREAREAQAGGGRVEMASTLAGRRAGGKRGRRRRTFRGDERSRPQPSATARLRLTVSRLPQKRSRHWPSTTSPPAATS